ncbi:MAG: hypothetical protein E5V90_09190 [Mesorhizobium sp.]|nr:MAG: hypothetical protein E5V90_09190 [Mesorhizobium sp.]
MIFIASPHLGQVSEKGGPLSPKCRYVDPQCLCALRHPSDDRPVANCCRGQLKLRAFAVQQKAQCALLRRTKIVAMQQKLY